ncbi:dTDP-4-dehydrorhamnose 3,5-epimerase [Helicobacter sp. MIT 14-3879]|uniref:dTDP-4-dehydrorhamnose 3,5-epimerase n=1 Tax=Helicobacter sp. MIT 14-3879 TaxID=2040649 RepID=UPI000E1FB025|nr:dTDP-4-dehydrorhamnose 3,5-epimerase [Helicobacter sp. MIT 14-3879]RDU61716.1 dTDP-4-dehydrorhamnose 3,5-epimerase [Helicobacter sp. MIT 14-3879]
MIKDNLTYKNIIDSQKFIFKETNLSGLFIIESKPIKDSRGYFERYFCASEFKAIGLNKPISQQSHSRSIGKGVIRGMHYQNNPFCEAKLVRCIRGSVYDVVVDIRRDSPTFLQHFSVELKEGNFLYLYVPEGFAHGFQTLSNECEILYSMNETFSPNFYKSLNPLDPKLCIKWPLKISNISDKDKNAAFIDNNFEGIML